MVLLIDLDESGRFGFVLDSLLIAYHLFCLIEIKINPLSSQMHNDCNTRTINWWPLSYLSACNWKMTMSVRVCKHHSITNKGWKTAVYLSTTSLRLCRLPFDINCLFWAFLIQTNAFRIDYKRSLYKKCYLMAHINIIVIDTNSHTRTHTLRPNVLFKCDCFIWLSDWLVLQIPMKRIARWTRKYNSTALRRGVHYGESYGSNIKMIAITLDRLMCLISFNLKLYRLKKDSDFCWQNVIFKFWESEYYAQFSANMSKFGRRKFG